MLSGPDEEEAMREDSMRRWRQKASILTCGLAFCVVTASTSRIATAKDDVSPSAPKSAPVLGLTGQVSDVRIAVPAADEVKALSAVEPPPDADFRNMAGWGMNYLTPTPRKPV